MLERAAVPATFFTTGESAQRFPERVREVAGAGHEIACHGYGHRPFPELTAEEAAADLDRATDALAPFARPLSFRAPYLRFPTAYLPMLKERGYRLDSSSARYKPWQPRARQSPLLRVPVSVTSSALRLPARVRDPYLKAQTSTVVLFVHPWEFVDMAGEAIPWHCRFRTGAPAAAALAEVIGRFQRWGARFLRMDALLAAD